MSGVGNNILNGNNGAATALMGISARAFAISVATGAGLFVAQAALFQLFKALPRLKVIYQPKTYLVPEKQRVKPPPNNPIKWFLEVFRTPDKTIIEKSGLDAFFFVNYLHILLKIFVPLGIIILPILLPLNFVNGVGTHRVEIQGAYKKFNVTGLDTLSWTNVSPADTSRFWAHLVLALLVIGWFCYVFFYALRDAVSMRQKYLTSPQHRLKASANTVLIPGIPADLCNEKALDALYDVYPGGIRKIWINRNFDPLAYKVSRRDELISKLENAETMLVRNANLKHRKQIESGGKAASKSKKSSTEDYSGEGEESAGGDMTRRTTEEAQEQESVPTRINQIDGGGTVGTDTVADDEAYIDDSDGKALWQQYLKQGNRDSMRIWRWGWTFWTSVPIWPLIFIPFSKPVDTIYYCRKEIAKLNREIEEDRKNLEKYRPLNSAFIQFNYQIAAHMCCQCISHHVPKQMTPRLVEISPQDIYWDNMSIRWWERYLRWSAVFVIFVGMIFLWGILVTFTGFLSQIDSVANKISWLHWILSLPTGLIALIKGLLPPLIVQLLLTSVVPILLRYLCRLEGVATGTIGERHLQNYYFAFLFIELFLVASISAGLTQVIPQIVSSPISVPTILAKNLPKSANYFFNYMILQALSISASHLIQWPSLLLKWIRSWFNPTPRERFMRQVTLDESQWGSFYPFYTTIAVIGFVYSVIAPLVLVFVTITFSLFWVVFRNNTMYVTKNTTETGGLLFMTAVNQLFTGLYVMEIALIGLFFLVVDTQGFLACQAQGIIMVVALVGTVAFQVIVNLSFGPLMQYMPITLEDDAVERDKVFEQAILERQNLNSEEATRAPEKDQDGSNGEVKAGPTTSDDKTNGKMLSRFGSVKLKQRAKHFSHTEQEAQLWRDPIAEIMMTHHDELEDLLPDERMELVRIAFTHPAVRSQPRVAWIPADELGISDDEIQRTQMYSKYVHMSNDGAYLGGKKLEIRIDRMPPDLSEYFLIEPEL